MPRVFNSTFENALRIILLLDAFGTPQNTDMLYATDFIVVYIAIGIDLDGKKDVLGMWVGENESAKFWATVLNSLKNRGVEDIFIACTDNLTGFSAAIEAVFPKTEVQNCIIHQLRNSSKYVS